MFCEHSYFNLLTLVRFIDSSSINIYIFKANVVSENDQKILQSQTADKPMAPRGRAKQKSRDTKKTNPAKQPALSR